MAEAAVHPLSLFIDSDALQGIRADFEHRWQALQQAAAQASLGMPKSRRFKGDAWKSHPQSLMAAHVWELYADTLQKLADQSSIGVEQQQRLSFALMQWIEAISPANFLATNPDVQQDLLFTQGASLLTGAQNFWQDLQKGRLSQTDESQFQLGENLATTPGDVVYSNALFELLHYRPSTATVKAIPLLVVPPCINKYYILDLQPRNSFVRHAVEQGYQVFLMSWRNPLPDDDDGIAQATWGDYLESGVLQAIDVVRDITQQPKINALGFCVGGTLLSSALSLAAAQGEHPVNALTLLTTMLDFEDVGALQVFVDEALACFREWQIGSGGLLAANELATTFAFLRPAELVWNYVTDNYLKGKTPPAFDLLYWNADGTNLPGPFFTWYFRNTYLENNLKKPEGVVINGHTLTLNTLTMPAYVYGSRDDHIVPWRSAYRSAQLLQGDVRFVLGASGHIAGVINPPADQKRHYWTQTTAGGLDKTQESEQWFDQAQQLPGSWWGDWMSWLEKYSGADITATTQTGNAQYPALLAAPGNYVRVRA